MWFYRECSGLEKNCRGYWERSQLRHGPLIQSSVCLSGENNGIIVMLAPAWGSDDATLLS